MQKTFFLIAMFGVVALLTACGNDKQQQELAQLKVEMAELKSLQVTMARRVGLGELVRPDTIPLQQGIRIGDEAAPIIIMEFTDLHCPFCKRFNDETYPELKSRFIDDGQVQFVARELPLLNIHPNAGMAAVALRCANKLGQYQAVKDDLFSKASDFSTEYLDGLGETYGFAQDEFDSCLQDVTVHSAVNEAMTQARELGLTSTPVFIVGKKQGDSVTAYSIIAGAQSIDTFAEAITRLLQ